MHVPETLKRARRDAGLSQKAMAALAGTSQATLSAYESGAKSPGVGTLDRLLTAAGYRLGAQAMPRRLRRPTEAELEARGRTLSQAISLAESLPHKRHAQLRYPRLPQPRRSA